MRCIYVDYVQINSAISVY